MPDTFPPPLPPPPAVRPDQLGDLEAAFGLFNIRLASRDVVSVRDTVAARAERPVLVCLHGIGSGSASWLEVARILGPRCRLLAWDAPGYGESTPLPQDAPRAADYAWRLRRLLQSLAIDDFVLVGHSLGALIASAYVAQAEVPLMPRALVLISPARGYGSAGRLDKGREVRGQRLRRLAESGIQGMAASRSSALLSANASAQARAWVHWNMARLHEGGYRQAVEMLCADDLPGHASAARAARPRLPVHVWCGSEDAVTTPVACQTVADAWGVPLRLIAAAGHACYVEQPGAVAQGLEQVLQSVAPPLQQEISP